MVDAGDDQVRAIAQQAEIGEARSRQVPSVAKPVLPSSNSISSTQIGDRVVMLRAVPLRFVCGAITRASTPSSSSAPAAGPAGPPRRCRRRL